VWSRDDVYMECLLNYEDFSQIVDSLLYRIPAESYLMSIDLEPHFKLENYLG
jgi:hypothetical protein